MHWIREARPAGHRGVDRGPAISNRAPLAASIDRVQHSDHHTIIERNVSRVAGSGGIALWEAAVSICASSMKSKPRTQRPRHGGVDPQADASLPDVPTADEQGLKGYDANTNGGFLAPAGTPKAIVAKLNAEINAALKLPDVRAKLEAAGIEIQGGTPQEYAALIKSDLAKWGKVVKEAGIGRSEPAGRAASRCIRRLQIVPRACPAGRCAAGHERGTCQTQRKGLLQLFAQR